MTKRKKPTTTSTWTEGHTTEASIHVVLPEFGRTHASMRQINGPGAPRDIVLDRELVVVGRSKTADVCVESPELSRQHVKIERQGSEFRIVDLDSRNGLYLNGIKVHACVLRRGDVVQIGNVQMTFREGA